MQHLAEQKVFVTKKQINWPLVTIILGLASVMLAFYGIFALDSWAESATWHHAVQHVAIFLSGFGFACSFQINRLRGRGGRQ